MNKQYQKAIYTWLIIGCVMVTAMVVVGGITRLTQSGLSMVKWEPIAGAIPPLSEAAWLEEFEAYQASPEFEFYNSHFSLSDFKQIYFWEYFHRLLGRIVGLVFLFPCLYFWMKGAFSAKLKKQVIIIFLGGLFQGVLGWYMVMSGLVDKPYVSHYRLAAHLLTALALAGYILWVAFGVKGVEKQSNGSLYKLGLGMLSLLGVQILYGAFVAGLKAGLLYNTFPKMGRTWIPEELGISFDLLGWMAIMESQGVVQLIHRVLAVAVAVMAVILWGRAKKSASSMGAVNLMVGLVAVQFLLGVFTLIYAVPVSLGVLHQLGAVLLMFSVIYFMYKHSRISTSEVEETEREREAVMA